LERSEKEKKNKQENKNNNTEQKKENKEKIRNKQIKRKREEGTEKIRKRASSSCLLSCRALYLYRKENKSLN